MRSSLLSGLVLLCLAAVPELAHAQYKNSSFGLDLGGWLITKPTVLNKPNELIDLDHRPNRISNGVRLGGELNFKMDEDHTWFVSRVNVGFLRYPAGNENGSLEERYDYQATKTLGTLLGIQGQLGVRYVFLTDRLRPYLQVSTSYLRTLSFTDAAGKDCDGDLCDSGDTDNQSEFLPHPNIWALHLEPGVEFVFTRDIAFHIFFDAQRWIIFNADDNNAVTLGAGFVFFT